jgi:parallel beta-helix repeat protein
VQTQSTLVVVLVAVITTVGFVPVGSATGMHDSKPSSDEGHEVPETEAVLEERARDEAPGEGAEPSARLSVEEAAGDRGQGPPVSMGPEPEASTGSPATPRTTTDTVQGVEAADCLPHPPIRITEDEGPQGFILGHEPATGQPIYRPGSGVTAGEGTAEDPYVIEGWCITPQAPEIVEQAPFGLVESAGIAIENTEAHVVIRDNRIDGNAVDGPGPDTTQQHGIELVDAANVAIEHNTITNNYYNGVLLDDSSGTTITNNTITNNGDGVYLYSSSGTTITNNTITNNNYDGVDLDDSSGATIANNTITNNGLGVDLVVSSGATIANNTITNNGDGVDLVVSSGATIANNTITNNGDGVDLYSSSGTTITNNTITNNGVGVGLFESSGVAMRDNEFGSNGVRIVGYEPNHYQHSIQPSNTVNGEPLVYVRNQEDVHVEQPAGQVILANTTNATVENVDVSDTSTGLQLGFTDNTTIANNTITNNNDDGVDLYDSSGTTITNNTITNNDYNGVRLYRSSGTTITNNTITNNNGDGGVVLDASSGTTITNNTITNNGDGVDLYRSSGTTITNNTITNNGVGVGLFESSGVEVHQNNIHDNTGAGLGVFAGDTVHAENNWWGAADGPSGGEDDACTDATADGNGDAITTNNAEVCFAPWRTSPNPDARAGG